jgi:hypothetical protein
MEGIFREISRLPEFEKDPKKLSKRFKTIEVKEIEEQLAKPK